MKSNKADWSPPMEEPSSPITEERKLKEIDLKISNTEFEHENLYKCCLSKNDTTDKRVLEFVAKTGISFSVLTFCFYQIINIDDECSSMLSFYTGLISLIIGTFIKSPQIEGKTK